MPTQVFLAAPHRVMFFGGVTQLLLVLSLWSIELLLRIGGGTTLFPALPSAIWHPLLMVFGFFPFLILGFLMTALPKWVGAPALVASRYLPTFFAMVVGWLLFYLAAVLGYVFLTGIALIVVAFGWATGGNALAHAARVDNPDKQHAHAAIGLVFLGAAMLALAGFGVLSNRPDWVRAVTLFSLWGVIVPVFVVVIHRMLPFFSQGPIRDFVPYRPMWMLWILLACLGLHGLSSGFVRVSGWAGMIVAMTDALAAGVALTLTIRWRFRDSFVNRLLATHHVAFAWLGLAFAAFAVQGALAVFGIDWGRQAPLHALSTGFLLLMVFGMLTRVTLGHSGLAIEAGAWIWRGFWILQAAVLLRLLAEFLPAAAIVWLLPVSAFGILGVFGAWGLRFGAHFFRPRADGLPG